VKATLWNLGKEGKEETMIVSNIEIIYLYAGRGYNDIYLLNNGEWDEKVRKSNRRD
jgi:hypothetical protein